VATVQVRYIVHDVDAAIDFYCRHLGFQEVMHPAPAFAMLADVEAVAGELRRAGVTFRNEVVTGVGGKQVLIEDPSGNPVELFQPLIPEARLDQG
jgi:catechol 2,3-dioxygenase-like lactoylglutathione lyase family enzyme